MTSRVAVGVDGREFWIYLPNGTDDKQHDTNLTFFIISRLVLALPILCSATRIFVGGFPIHMEK
jgi:hypothetical protein